MSRNLRLTFLFIICSTTLLQTVHDSSPIINVTIFIHGTTQFALSIFNPRKTWFDCLTDDCVFPRAVKSIRDSKFAEQSDIMLHYGPIEVTQEISQAELPEELRHKAAYHIIKAYHNIAYPHKHTTSYEHNRYFTFGWSGLLSEKARETAGEQLYFFLATLQQEIEASGKQVRFTVHTHSHGAQLVLHAAKIATIRKNDKFFIEYAFLSAPPLYFKNAQFAGSKVFGTIINIYSEGDRIQASDFISTPERSCQRTFRALKVSSCPENSVSPRILDMRVLAHHNPIAFGHASFFILDRYYAPSYLRHRRKVVKVFRNLTPLPLVTLYPLFMPRFLEKIRESPCSSGHYDINFTIDTFNNFLVNLEKYGTKKVITQVNISDNFLAEKNRIIAAYQDHGFVSEFRKTWYSFCQAWKTPVKKKSRRKACYNQPIVTPIVTSKDTP